MRVEDSSNKVDPHPQPRPVSRLSTYTQDSEFSYCSSAASDPGLPTEIPGEWPPVPEPPEGMLSSCVTLESRIHHQGSDEVAWAGAARARKVSAPDTCGPPLAWLQKQDSSLSRKIEAAFSYRLQDVYERAMTERFLETR